MNRSHDDIEAETVTLYSPSSAEGESDSDDDGNVDNLRETTTGLKRTLEGIEAETVTLYSLSSTEEESESDVDCNDCNLWQTTISINRSHEDIAHHSSSSAEVESENDDYDGHSDGNHDGNDSTEAKTASFSYSPSKGEGYDDDDNDDDEAANDNVEELSLHCNVVSPRPSSFRKANEYDDDNYGERKSEERFDSEDNEGDGSEADTGCNVYVPSRTDSNNNNNGDEVSTSDVADEGFGCCGKKSIVKVKKRKNIFIGWICSKILKVFVKSRVLL